MGLDVTDLWPVTIVRSRYGGVYEGGDWVAHNLLPDEVPQESMGEDVECQEWFVQNRRDVGVGNTPQDAYNNLLAL